MNQTLRNISVSIKDQRSRLKPPVCVCGSDMIDWTGGASFASNAGEKNGLLSASSLRLRPRQRPRLPGVHRWSCGRSWPKVTPPAGDTSSLPRSPQGETRRIRNARGSSVTLRPLRAASPPPPLLGSEERAW